MQTYISYAHAYAMTFIVYADRNIFKTVRMVH